MTTGEGAGRRKKRESGERIIIIVCRVIFRRDPYDWCLLLNSLVRVCRRPKTQSALFPRLRYAAAARTPCPKRSVSGSWRFLLTTAAATLRSEPERHVNFVCKTSCFYFFSSSLPAPSPSPVSDTVKSVRRCAAGAAVVV